MDCSHNSERDSWQLIRVFFYICYIECESWQIIHPAVLACWHFWLVMTWMSYPINLSSHSISNSRIANVSSSWTGYFCCTVMKILEINPAGWHSCHVCHCPYIASMPDFDASHINHIASFFEGSISHMTRAFSHIYLIMAKHFWWRCQWKVVFQSSVSRT